MSQKIFYQCVFCLYGANQLHHAVNHLKNTHNTTSQKYIEVID